MKNQYRTSGFNIWIGIFLLCFLACISCNTKADKKTAFTTMVFTTDLVNEPELIRSYDSLHSKTGVWPELKKANLVSGIHEVKIYRVSNRLFMMITVPADADLAKVDSMYLGSDKKIKVWNAMMANFQRALPGMDTTRKWSSMELIHHYADGEYLK